VRADDARSEGGADGAGCRVSVTCAGCYFFFFGQGSLEGARKEVEARKVCSGGRRV
jgi:hypothetical protein